MTFENKNIEALLNKIIPQISGTGTYLEPHLNISAPAPQQQCHQSTAQCHRRTITRATEQYRFFNGTVGVLGNEKIDAVTAASLLTLLLVPVPNK
jgi:hypothetical protein